MCRRLVEYGTNKYCIKNFENTFNEKEEKDTLEFLNSWCFSDIQKSEADQAALL